MVYYSEIKKIKSQTISDCFYLWIDASESLQIILACINTTITHIVFFGVHKDLFMQTVIF